MKRNCFSNTTVAVLCLLAFTACEQRRSHAPVRHATQVPDSHVIRATHPVNARVLANVSTIRAESGKRIFSVSLNGVITYNTQKQRSISSRVGGRIEQLAIRYNFQPVKKGDKIMEVYSPELAAAQRELIYLQRNGETQMLARAKQRLQLMGMRDREINSVLATGEVLYRVPVYSPATGFILERTVDAPQVPAPDQPAQSSSMASMSNEASTPSAAVPVQNSPAEAVQLREGQYITAGQSLFTVYESEDLVAEIYIPTDLVSHVSRGTRLLLYPQHDKEKMRQAQVGLVEPVFRNGQSFSVARIYLQSHSYKAGELITARMPVVYSGGWWLPASAVWQAGEKSFVFLKSGDVFVPKEVVIKATVNGQVMIASDIRDWDVAGNAAFLVDSESFITNNSNINEP